MFHRVLAIFEVLPCVMTVSS